MTRFSDLLYKAYQRSGSTLAIGIVPRTKQLPPLIQRYDDPFLPFGRAIIAATNDVVAAYVFHLGAYLSIGAAGAIALERTIAYVPKDVIKIIHAPFASADFVRAVYEDAFGTDAVTLATGVAEVVSAYVQQSAHGVYIDAAHGAAASVFAAEYRGQVGVAQAVGEQHTTLQLMDIDAPVLHWQWGSQIYSSRGGDFEEALRTAALQWKQNQ